MDKPSRKTNIDGVYVHERLRNVVLTMVLLSIYLQGWENIINSSSYWKFITHFKMRFETWQQFQTDLNLSLATDRDDDNKITAFVIS